MQKAVFLCLGSTLWRNPGLGASANQNPYWEGSQIKTSSTVGLGSSEVAPNRSIQGKNAPSSQRASVGADLGDEWDDWGDFDEENLVQASETSATLCTTNYHPQGRPAAGASKAGAVSSLRQLCKESIVILIFLTEFWTLFQVFHIQVVKWVQFQSLSVDHRSNPLPL